MSLKLLSEWKGPLTGDNGIQSNNIKLKVAKARPSFRQGSRRLHNMTGTHNDPRR